MAAPIDWTDPCARYAALRDAYFQAISGATRRIRFQNGNNVQEIEYGALDVSSLREEMGRAQAECQALNGQSVTARRFAIQVGARAQPLAVTLKIEDGSS